MPYNICFQERNYKKERDSYSESVTVTNHPLKPVTVKQVRLTNKNVTQSTVSNTDSKPSAVKESVDPLGSSSPAFDPLSSNDPLSSAVRSPLDDPLSRIASSLSTPLLRAPALDPDGAGLLNEKNTDAAEFTKDGDVPPAAGLEPWSARRTTILAHYTTSEKLTIVSSFLVSQAGENVRVVAPSARRKDESTMEKVKSRLEQLDTFEEGSVKETSNLSQQEFVVKISELQKALRDAWELDQRVRALQIVIQCTKLLSDVSAVKFYPSKFVLITDLLDTFGSLVYDRLKTKSASIVRGARNPVPLSDNFKPSQVPEAAKETARNWFFKIASIRELMPRLYVEAAILRCYRFLEPDEIPKGLLRLTEMCRGIADPLVACYARCYLARIGIAAAPSQKTYLMNAFNDFLRTDVDLSRNPVKRVLGEQKVAESVYMTLYSPALDWLLQCLCGAAPDEELERFLAICKETKNPLLINSALSSFPPQFISNKADVFTGLIYEMDKSSYPKHLLCQQLGLCLVMYTPPDSMRLSVLNTIWKMVAAIPSPRDYMTCADAWAEYIARHFGKKQVNFLFSDVIRHVTPDRAFETLYNQLQSVLTKVITSVPDFQDLFDSDQFLSYLNIFEKTSVKAEVYRGIMEALLSQLSRSESTTSDPVLIDTALWILQTLHDGLHSLCSQDERRVVTRLAVQFISKVDMGDQVDRQLDFYVKCRANLCNLESVLIHLIHCVNALSIQALKTRRGTHTVKTASFVRACVAYSFITIPSLTDILVRIRLYISTAHVALMNGCLGQADACYKTAITLLLDLAKPPPVVSSGSGTSQVEPSKVDEALVIELASTMASSLLMTPDNVSQGCLYLVKGLLNAIQAFPWDASSDGKYTIFMRVLCLLAALRQPRYLYHSGPSIDANDTLYGGDPVFIGEVNAMGSTLVAETLSHMKTVEGNRRGDLAAKLLTVILHQCDLSDNDTRTLASNLWGLVQGRGGKGQASTVQQVALVNCLRARATAPGSNDISKEFAAQLLSS